MMLNVVQCSLIRIKIRCIQSLLTEVFAEVLALVQTLVQQSIGRFFYLKMTWIKKNLIEF